ncbi:MerR family transcriptional regulator [Novosphingobium sp. YAF33]|jgi:DNA-binding transcriptional MerR regulator
MKMRELEQRTGVHREVIRLYLRSGVIPEPDRPKRTVAIYREDHVQAIATVRKLQHESRLSLSQIKALMEGGGQQPRVDTTALDQLEQLVAHRAGEDQGPVTVASLLETYPSAAEDTRILAAIGVLAVIETPDGDALSISDAQMVRIWGDMRKAGFDAHLDYTPEVLGFYVEAADFVGKWEATTFLERVTGRVEVGEAADLVEQALPLMLDFFGVLRQRAFFRHFDAIRGQTEA